MNALATTATTIEQVAFLSDRFATRKVTDQDITVKLCDLARDIVNEYSGTFAFMVNMKNELKWGLSASQVAAVINCAISDYRYALRAQGKQPVQVAVAPERTYNTTTQVVADGHYTVVGPQGGHRTLKVETVEAGQVRQWLSYLCGQDNESEYKSIGFITGDKVTLFNKYAGQFSDIIAAARFLVRNVAKLDEMGRQYAIRSGRCYRCNRMLTTPESVARGMGPICAEKVQ